VKYTLQELLRVREFRETSRANEMKVKKARLNDAERMVAIKKEELSEYRIWRVQKEDSLYEEVQGSYISLKDLDNLKLKVSLLREKEALLDNNLVEAEKARETVREEFQRARNAYHHAVREKRKIEEHKKIWLEEMAREEERATDKEMEEFQRRMIHPDMEEEIGESF
jgi:hypothetical protein